jgi:hypothetical protein
MQCILLFKSGLLTLDSNYFFTLELAINAHPSQYMVQCCTFMNGNHFNFCFIIFLVSYDNRFK